MTFLNRITLLSFMFLPLPTLAEEDIREMFNELKAQVKTLQTQVQQSNTRINELEKELSQAQTHQTVQSIPAITPPPSHVEEIANKPAVTTGDVKGTFKISGTDTSLGFGGYVKTDVLFNSVSAGRDKFGDQYTTYSQIPLGKRAGEHSQITFNAKESRIWFRSFTPSKWGDINTLLEMDFYGDPATYTYTPRLRHAYGSIGNLLVGQTWTTFLNTNVLPNLLDSGGSAGAVYGVRQPLVRWTQPFTLSTLPMDFQLALESPRSRIRDVATADADVFSTPNADRYPDLVARLNLNPDWGKFSLATLGRQIRNTNSLGNAQAEWSGAVSLAGKINSIDLDSVRFMFSYGNALGRYIASSNTFEDAVFSNGNLQLIDLYSGMLSYQHFWSKEWQSNITYGFVHANQIASAGNNITSQVQSVHANLLWSPISQTILGMEYIYATRDAFDGRDGELQRVQFSARYNF